MKTISIKRVFVLLVTASLFVLPSLDAHAQSIPNQTITDSYRMVAINWGWDGEGDIDYSGNTIWYNTDGSAWCPNSVSSFDEYNGMIYGFHY